MNISQWLVFELANKSLWAALLIMLPLIAAVLIFILGRRSALLFVPVAIIGILVSVLNLITQVWTQGAQYYAIGGWAAPLGIEWYVDGLSVVMLSMTAVVGCLISWYGSRYIAWSQYLEEVSRDVEVEKENVRQDEQDAHNEISTPHEELEYPLVLVPEEKISNLPVLVKDSEELEGSTFPKSKANFLFWPLSLLLWSGLNALFLSANLFNLYISLEILTLAIVPIMILGGGVMGSRYVVLHAAMRYLLVAMFASMFYLLGIVLLYGTFGTLDIQSLALEIKSGPTIWVAMFLIFFGLLTKTALFPLHFWLAPTYANAPAPVNALSSALVINASFYILLRLWFEIFPNELLPNVSQILGILGAIAIIWGSWQALQQQSLTRLLAYSTVAQVGTLFLLFPLSYGINDTWSITAWHGGIYQIFSHALAKAAMFMAAGNILFLCSTDRFDGAMRGIGRVSPITLITLTLAGLSIIGLPPSGGFSANWALLNAAWESGQWWWIIIIIIGTLLTAAYVFKVLREAFEKLEETTLTARHSQTLPFTMVLIPLLLALTALTIGLISDSVFTLLEIGLPFEILEK